MHSITAIKRWSKQHRGHSNFRVICSRFALAGLFLLLLTQTVRSQNSQPSATSSTPNVTISRRTFEQCKQAFDEVQLSRELLDAKDKQIAALEENIRLRDQMNTQLRELVTLKDQQLKERADALAAEKDAKKTTEQQLAVETERANKAERSRNRWRKIAAFSIIGNILTFGVLR